MTASDSPPRLAEPIENRLVGLLMIRNENDILEDVLRNAVVFCDRILVLDGSDPEEHARTKRICGRFPEVRSIIRDEETQGPFPLRDGARHYLLKQSRELYGSGRWIAVLHGDEFYTRDPRPFLALADPARTPVVRLKLCHFFLHQRDAKDWARLSRLPVEKRVTAYMWPGTPEDRFFYDDPRFSYDASRHSLVVPYDVTSFARFEPENLVVKQYNYRDPAQMVKRARERIDSRWQSNHYQHIVQDSAIFVESLHVPGYDPCGWDNVVQADADKRSRPRFLEDALLLRLTDKPRPVFIGGTGRSGTTVAKRMLGSHPGIASVRPESKFISMDGGLVDMLRNGAHGRFEEFRRKMQDFTPIGEDDFVDRTVDNWGARGHDGGGSPYDLYEAELDHLEDILVHRDVPQSLREMAIGEFIRFLYDRLAVRKNAIAWVEQTPRNIRWGRELLRLFPNALFIHLYRDPRDVICSLLRMWWGPRSVVDAIPYFRERWNQWQESRRGILEDGNADRLIEIRFESMVETGGSHGLADVLAKLGLPAMAFPIDAASAHIRRWRSELDAESVRNVERELRDVLVAGDYATAGGLTRARSLDVVLKSVVSTFKRRTRA